MSCGCSEPPSPSERPAMDPDVVKIMTMHAMNGAQRAANGADAYAENLRYDYLEGKSNVSMTEGLGVRYIQGPHPYFGSPDAAKA